MVVISFTVGNSAWHLIITRYTSAIITIIIIICISCAVLTLLHLILTTTLLKKLALPSFLQPRNLGIWELSNLPEITNMVTGRIRIHTQSMLDCQASVQIYYSTQPVPGLKKLSPSFSRKPCPITSLDSSKFPEEVFWGYIPVTYSPKVSQKKKSNTSVMYCT